MFFGFRLVKNGKTGKNLAAYLLFTMASRVKVLKTAGKG